MLPSELANNVTDDHRSKFGFVLELDPNPRSKNAGSDSLDAQTVIVGVNNREVVADLETCVVDHLCQLCKDVGVANCRSDKKLIVKTAPMLITSSSAKKNWNRSKGLTATSTASS